MIRETYIGMLIATTPITHQTPTLHERNSDILARYQAGESLHTLAEVFGITEQRVYQIVRGRRK